jgi:hypothetical protein
MSILRKAQKAGMTISEFCRRMVLDGRIVEAPKLSSGQVKFLKYLIGCNNNFTRIANFMRNQSPELTEEIRRFLVELKQAFYSAFNKK